MKRVIENHLLRNLRGQLYRGRKRCRASWRGSINGHARQKKLPARSRTKTRAPRKWTQLTVVARFLGARVGPKNPCRSIKILIINSGICNTVRACRQRRNCPRNGASIRSTARESCLARGGDECSGGLLNNLLTPIGLRLRPSAFVSFARPPR